MQTVFYPVPFLVIVLIFLIRAEILKIRKQIYIFKPVATLLVIAVAIFSLMDPAWNRIYAPGILVGLFFSLGGDLALMFQENRRAFTIGLGLFLLAHITYTVVFFRMGSFTLVDIPVGVVLIVPAVTMFVVMKPKLGRMKVPVIFYLLIISLMVSRAFSLISGDSLNRPQVVMIVCGACLFYISDVILALSRFHKFWKYNRISLAFYYSGQLFFALAAGFFC
ncbi:MAG: lysoplasmalogenase [Spirochaetales bacterium]|nr:lysoplasmalogenase [Spirochaetales bacterium]